MKKWLKECRWCVVIAAVLAVLCGGSALASEDDNSLYSLGIQTEGATVSPEFSYDVWSYTVTVPAGTTELSLDPIPSSESARIRDIFGTTLNADGSGYVTIVVEAANGTPFTYELNVVADGPAPATEAPTEAPTEPPTEEETEPETEDPRYVRVDRNSLQEAENTITELKNEVTAYRDRLGLFTKIMYGLIALAVILLFVVINLLLRKKDIKAELDDYRSYGYTENDRQDPQPPQEPFYPQGYPQNNGYGMPPRPVNGQPQPPYAQGGLDVQPMKSQKKAKTMPQYEQPAPRQQPAQNRPQQPAAPQAQAQAQGAPANAQPKDAPAKKGRGKDVQINMIDL